MFYLREWCGGSNYNRLPKVKRVAWNSKHGQKRSFAIYSWEARPDHNDGTGAVLGKDNTRRAEALPRSVVIHRPESEGLFYLWTNASVNECCTFKLLPMPARKCTNGKWRWGNGNCIYETKKEAEKAGVAIEIKRRLDEKKWELRALHHAEHLSNEMVLLQPRSRNRILERRTLQESNGRHSTTSTFKLQEWKVYR